MNQFHCISTQNQIYYNFSLLYNFPSKESLDKIISINIIECEIVIECFGERMKKRAEKNESKNEITFRRKFGLNQKNKAFDNLEIKINSNTNF